MATTPDPPRLDDAYFSAVYFSHGRAGYCFRFAPAIAARSCLSLDLAEPWGMLTAYNPESQKLSPAVNAERDEALRVFLASRGYEKRLQRAAASDDQGHWREPGWIIESVSRDDLLDAARRFRQRAVVLAVRGKTGLLFSETERWVVRPIIQAPMPE
jgi:hypothetical protein